MENQAEKNNISTENRRVRDDGLAASREFERVANLFNRVMLVKEEMRKGLEKEYGVLGKQAKQNLESLQTLARNIEIYEKNDEKIALNLKHLDSEEAKAKEAYENLLKGSQISEMVKKIMPVSNIDGEPSTNVDKSRETLIKRRRNFLESLDSQFRNLEEELFSIDNLRKKFEKARSEISKKYMDATKKKLELEDNGKAVLEEVRFVEMKLNNSIQEEKLLIEEFSNLIRNVESSLEIDEKIDQVLFSYLNNEETLSGSTNPRD